MVIFILFYLFFLSVFKQKQRNNIKLKHYTIKISSILKIWPWKLVMNFKKEKEKNKISLLIINVCMYIMYLLHTNEFY